MDEIEESKKQFEFLCQQLGYRYFIDPTIDSDIQQMYIGLVDWGKRDIECYGFIIAFLANHNYFELAIHTVLSHRKLLTKDLPIILTNG